MSALVSWLSMGGYYAYVWPAYGLVFLVLIMNSFVLKKQSNRIRQRLVHWLKRNAV